MKKILLRIALVLLIVIVLAGAYLHFYPEKGRNIIIPEVEQVEDIQIKVVGDTARYRLGLRLKNKGPFKMNIDSVIYKIKFDTATLLSRAQDINVILKTGESDTFRLPVHLPYKRLLSQIKRVQDQDSVPIIMNFRIVYSTVFGKTSLPIKKVKTIAVPIPPKFELEELEYVGMNKKTLFFNLHIRMDNPGRLDLLVSDLRYDLKVEDLLTADGKYLKNIKVNPRSVIEEPIPVELHIIKGLKILLKIISKDEVNYQVRITGEAETKKSKEKTKVEISKNGSMRLRKRKNTRN